MCRTCYSTANTFRKALLEGCYLGAMEAYSTGCVNLRVPCGHVSEEVWLRQPCVPCGHLSKEVDVDVDADVDALKYNSSTA